LQDAGFQSITTFGYQVDILINILPHLKKTFLNDWEKIGRHNLCYLTISNDHFKLLIEIKVGNKLKRQLNNSEVSKN